VTGTNSSVILHKCVLFHGGTFIVMYSLDKSKYLEKKIFQINPNHAIKYEYLKLVLNPGFS
jgi:hypothetical protein